MSETFYIVPTEQHNALLARAHQQRGYAADEAAAAVRLAESASRCGIRTHNGIKALQLDRRFGSSAGGCVPGAEIEKIACRFPTSQIWNANKKPGQATAYAAIEAAIALAEQYGVGQVSVDNAFHYLWGGGYVMEAAKRGYIAYTNCTTSLAQVAPCGGAFPTLGTNPHSWGFPTVGSLGFPIVIDWATSAIAMGRVQQLRREGLSLPPHAALDKDGKSTLDPNAVNALLPFGGHKGYSLGLINELVGAFIGGSLPTLRGRAVPEGEKASPSFYFQVIHPDSLNSGLFAQGRSQGANVKAVLNDILGHGNAGSRLPGQGAAQWAERTRRAGGLLFSAAEIAAFNEIARECGERIWDRKSLKVESA